MPYTTASIRVLDLRCLIYGLVADVLLKHQDANVLLGPPRTREQTQMHPLSYIASLGLEDPARPGKLLDGDRLAYWLAESAGLPVVHIDPLKVDVPKVTEIMSYAFAKRHGILCLEVANDEVGVGCMQNFVSGCGI